MNSVPTSSIALFERFRRASEGYPVEDILDAAFNTIVDALCQSYRTHQEAVMTWDELTNKFKTHLVQCYDTTGRKKPIYQYHQMTIGD